MIPSQNIFSVIHKNEIVIHEYLSEISFLNFFRMTGIGDLLFLRHSALFTRKCKSKKKYFLYTRCLCILALANSRIRKYENEKMLFSGFLKSENYFLEFTNLSSKIYKARRHRRLDLVRIQCALCPASFNSPLIQVRQQSKLKREKTKKGNSEQ